MIERLGFVIVIESGDLEAKTTLLVESIRRVPSLNDCPIHVVQPRRGDLPSAKTLRVLSAHDAWFSIADLNRTWRHHGPMNKAYAAALVEEWVEHTIDTLVFLDSDTLVISSLDDLVLAEPHVAAVAPIAQQRVGQIGQSITEALNPYWTMMYEVCGVSNPPSWAVTTTIDRQAILPYFNSGVVAVRPTAGIFRRWREHAERLARDSRAQQLPDQGREFFFLDQVLLAGTLVSQLTQSQIRVLDHHFNYPLPAHHLLPHGVRVACLDEIAIVHYHAMLSNLYWLDDIAISQPLKAWLMPRLPLRPRLRFARPTPILMTSWMLSQLPLRRYHHRLVSRLPKLHTTVPIRPQQ